MKFHGLCALLLVVGCGATREDSPTPSSDSGGSSSGSGGVDGGDSGGQTGDSGGTSSGGDAATGGVTTQASVFPHVRRIAAAGWKTCAIETGGNVVCWEGDVESAPLTGEFVEISMQEVDEVPLCGVRVDGTLDCDSDGYPTESGFEHVTVLRNETGCASKSDGTLVCWGYGEDYEHPESGDFDALTSRRLSACGLKLGQPAVCWPSDPALDSITSDRVDMAGGLEWCQIVSGQVDCRGSNPFQGLLDDAAQVAVSAEVVCALDSDGRRLCSGPDSLTLNLPPDTMRFVELAVGTSHACGVEMDTGLVRCWGTALDISGSEGPASVPRDVSVF